MPIVPYSFPFTGGLDDVTSPNRASQGSFSLLTNLRQARTKYCSLEATPRFVIDHTTTQGTYYFGGSLTEPTSSSVQWYGQVGDLGPITLTSYCGFAGAVQMRALWKTAEPADYNSSDLTKKCLLKVNSVSTMTVTLGNGYDIVIDGAATFKWRVNGGSYTTTVAIDATNGNAIDGGAIQLWWLVGTGFTVNDTWSWRRNDAIVASASQGVAVYGALVTDVGLFFWLNDTTIGVVERSSADSVPYIRTVGYAITTGSFISIYEEHLFISNYGNSGPFIANSDLNNFDNLVSTDVNEADNKQLRLSTRNGVSVTLYTIASFIIQTRLYIITSVGMYYTDYAGLPLPFSFKQLFGYQFAVGGTDVVETATGAYIYTNGTLFSFDGLNLSKIRTTTASGNFRLVYSAFYRELILWSSNTIIAYQEDYKTFYSRACSFAGMFVSFVGVSDGQTLYIGIPSRITLAEDVQASGTPVYDFGGGVSFAAPTVRTQMIGGTMAVSESAPIYIGPTIPTGGSSHYVTGTAIVVTLSWYVSIDGITFGTALTNAAAVWTSALPDGMITFPRVSYRYIAYQLTVTSTDATKPPKSFSLQAIETEIYDAGVKR